MEQTEDETISLEETLSSLKRNAKAVDIYFHESRKKLKEFQHKLLKEKNGISEATLQPRTRMMKWLTDRGLPEESTFVDFFEMFIEEHKKENRLDISKRTLSLNNDACILFGIKSKENSISLYDLLERINVLYY
jgi:hypothetical protein